MQIYSSGDVKCLFCKQKAFSAAKSQMCSAEVIIYLSQFSSPNIVRQLSVTNIKSYILILIISFYTRWIIWLKSHAYGVTKIVFI